MLLQMRRLQLARKMIGEEELYRPLAIRLPQNAQVKKDDSSRLLLEVKRRRQTFADVAVPPEDTAKTIMIGRLPLSFGKEELYGGKAAPPNSGQVSTLVIYVYYYYYYFIFSSNNSAKPTVFASVQHRDHIHAWPLDWPKMHKWTKKMALTFSERWSGGGKPSRMSRCRLRTQRK